MPELDDTFPQRGLSFNDDKIKEKEPNESIELTTEPPGDVYDDSRAIDLGADGKERPIGRVYSLCTCNPIPYLLCRNRH
jgi:hypothetical protein